MVGFGCYLNAIGDNCPKSRLLHSKSKSFLLNAGDSAIFALTWMAGHCTTLGPTCDRLKYEQWDQYSIHHLSQSFTIHGLWPSQQSYRDFGDFNFQLFKKPLLEDMYNYWPPQPKTGGLPHFLW